MLADLVPGQDTLAGLQMAFLLEASSPGRKQRGEEAALLYLLKRALIPLLRAPPS